jgi:glycerol kinase
VITETTALGAAFLAGLATGYWSGTEDLLAQWRIDRRFLPEMSGRQAGELKARWHRAVERARNWETE